MGHKNFTSNTFCFYFMFSIIKRNAFNGIYSFNVAKLFLSSVYIMSKVITKKE